MKINKNIISKSLVIRKERDNKYSLNVENFRIEAIKKGDVLVKTSYSSLNYKDVLLCSGNPGLVRRYPHVPGIDASGTVIESKSKKFKVGDKVIIVARPMGVSCFGGLSEYIKISSNLIEKKPINISLKESMIFGTAGFTAMMAVMKLLESKTKILSPVLVTGSTGGVGSLIIYILKIYKLKIIAATSSLKNKKYLKEIGADEVITYADLKDYNNLPLLKEKYSGVIDTIGLETISNCLKQINKKGQLILIGNVCSENVNINLMPLILRGISILGINAEAADNYDRKKIWKHLSKIIKSKNSNLLYKEVGLKEVKKNTILIRKNKHLGRVIVNLNS